ncbi:MAG: CYTH domain-containing protein [Desulfitobacteriaceae bacterium]
MSREIERKFLVSTDKLPTLIEGQRFVQGYLKENPQIRFRLVDERIIITIKSPLPDGSRFELETEKTWGSLEERQILQDLAIFPVIQKIRYSVPFKELVWEIDVYEGVNRGLITVDVELPFLDYSISFPEWVNLEGEITSDPRYFNTNLAQTPYSSWNQSAV